MISMILTSTGLALSLLAAAAMGNSEHPNDILVLGDVSGPVVEDNSASRDVLLVDLDGDGDLDLLMANLDQDNALYWNDGGAFTKEMISPFVHDGGNSRGLAAGDVDGDGDLDVFVTNSKDEANALYLNQGGNQGGIEGQLVAMTGVPIVTDIANSRKALFADIDADGDLDLFVANFNGQANYLYVNQGGMQAGTMGDFVRVLVGDVVTDGGSSYDADFADIDNDGDLDLFVTNHDGLLPPSPGERNFLYRNNGVGVFTGVLTGPLVNAVANSLSTGFADVDGDGDQDLFVGNDEIDNNILYFNDGLGRFIPGPGRPIGRDRGESIDCCWSDIDLDGDLDLLLANRAGQPNALYLNNGTGAFTRQEFGPLYDDRADSYGVDVGDLDNDGSPEIVVVNLTSPNLLYRNLGVQWLDLGEALAGSAGDPRLNAFGNLTAGEAVGLWVDNGPPTEPASMIVGFSAVYAPLKGGILVPSPDLLLTGLVTDRLGTMGVAGTIPVGLPSAIEIIFQGWIADPGAPQSICASNALRVLLP